MTSRILIVEDEPIIMQDIAECLSSLGYDIAGKAYSAQKAFQVLDKRITDLVLLDINLEGDLDGVDIAHQINDTYKLPFIYLTSYADQTTLSKVKVTKPSGYVVKPFEEKELFAAIEVALFNYNPTNSSAKSITVDSLLKEYAGKLTQQEVKILFDIYSGKANKEISSHHNISLNTVKTHVKKIYDKLDVHSRSEVLVLLRALV